MHVLLAQYNDNCSYHGNTSETAILFKMFNGTSYIMAVTQNSIEVTKKMD